MYSHPLPPPSTTWDPSSRDKLRAETLARTLRRMSVSQSISDPYPKAAAPTSRSTGHPRSGPTLSLFHADKATFAWPNFEATRTLPNGSDLLVHYHHDQQPPYADSRSPSRAPLYPAQYGSPRPASHLENDAPPSNSYSDQRGSHRSFHHGTSQSTRHGQTHLGESSYSRSQPSSLYPEHRGSLRSETPPRHRQTSYEEYNHSQTQSSAPYVDQRGSLRPTSSMRHGQTSLEEYGHNRPPPSSTHYVEQPPIPRSPDVDRSSRYTAYHEHRHTSSSNSPDQLHSPRSPYSHQYDAPSQARNSGDNEPPYRNDWRQDQPQSAVPLYYGHSSHSRHSSQQEASLHSSSSSPENAAREPEWEIYTQKVRGLDGAALYGCIWEAESGKPCNYVAKKQLVKRHILATHLGHKPYPCTFPGCTKAFSQRTSRDTHLYGHTKERPHKCPYDDCKQAFSDPARRHKHMVEIHGYTPGPRVMKQYNIGRRNSDEAYVLQVTSTRKTRVPVEQY